MITPEPMPRCSVRLPCAYVSCATSIRTTAGKSFLVTLTTASGVAEGKGSVAFLTWVGVVVAHPNAKHPHNSIRTFRRRQNQFTRAHFLVRGLGIDCAKPVEVATGG